MFTKWVFLAASLANKTRKRQPTEGTSQKICHITALCPSKKQIVAADGPIPMQTLLPWKFFPQLNCCDWESQNARWKKSTRARGKMAPMCTSARQHLCGPNAARGTVMWIECDLKGGKDEERQKMSSHIIVLDVRAGDEAAGGGQYVAAWIQTAMTKVIYVFWGSGEMGPGVLVPSRLWTGIWNWGVRTDGNWNR